MGSAMGQWLRCCQIESDCQIAAGHFPRPAELDVRVFPFGSNDLALRRRNAHDTRSAGSNPAAADRLQALVQANLNRRETVAAAAQCQAGTRNPRICRSEKAKNVLGRHGSLRDQSAKLRWNSDGFEGLPRSAEVIIRRKTGAGPVLLPLVLQQTRVAIDIAVLRRIGWTGRIRAALRIRAVIVLRPQAVHHKRRVLGALRCRTMRGTELRRPGQIEQVIVETALARIARLR